MLRLVNTVCMLMNAHSSTTPAVAKIIAALAPSRREAVMRLRGDLRLGTPVVLTSGADAALVIAVETLGPDRHAALAQMEQPCQLALSRYRAEGLGLAVPDGADVLRLTLPDGMALPHIRALADPLLGAAALPGPVPPLVAGGAIHQAGVALAKSAQILPAVLVLPIASGPAEAARLGLCVADALDVLHELAAAIVQRPVSNAALPMTLSQSGRVHVYRPDDGSIEHYAIEIAAPDLSRPVLVRLHSACFTGDVLGSLKCDCGPQLHAAITAMADAGGGVLLYLNQEGRGIGMANKMRAYALQDRGLDTVEANHTLGFHDDERDFRNGAALLRQLGIGRVRLLTNNPAKVAVLQGHGVQVVERVPLRVGQTAQNARYLATKALKSGHLLT